MLPWVFAGRGVLPIGYALLASVAGLVAGLLLRRTVPAMAVTLLVVAGLQIAVPLTVRPWLAQPVTSVTPLDPDQRMGISMSMDTGEMRLQPAPDSTSVLKGSRVLSNSVITPAGAEFTGPADTTKCGPEAPAERQTCPDWLRSQNLSQETVYVPGARFWALQWRELGLLIAVTALLSGFALWWIRRRLV